MPVTPDGKIINESGQPTGQTVDTNTGAISGVQNIPASQTTVPTNNLSTPAIPTANPVTTSSVASSSAYPTTPPTAPVTSGASRPLPNGVSVIDLLNSAGQSSDFASRTKLAQQYGMQGYSGTATQNLQLGQKYRDMYEQNKGIEAPQNGSQARSAFATYQEKNPAQTSSQQEPEKAFIDSYYSMNPVVKNLYDTLHSISSAVNDKQSFVDEYKQMRQEADVPGLQTDLLNINNVMRGTEQDVRDEITKAGGFATESQVQALTATRNRLLQKKASSLTDQLQVANDYVNQVSKLTQADREQVWKKIDAQVGLTEKMATVQNDITNAARTNYQKAVDNIGYDGLAQTLQNNPGQMRYVESLLGLPGGSLSNPTFIANAKTLKEQTLAATMANRDIINSMAQERLNHGAQRLQIQIQGVPGSNAPDILASQVQYYKSTGQLPPFGFGAAGQIARNNFWRAVASEGQDITSDAQLNKVTRSAMGKALSTQQNQYSATKTSIDTLDKQLALVQQLSGQTDRTGVPIGNKYLLYVKGQYAGDVNTARLQNAVQTASAEFAKILSGATASISGSTVTSMEEAKNLINANMTKAQLEGVIQQMRNEGQYRLSSQKHTINQLESDISNIGKRTTGINTGSQTINYNGKRYQTDAQGNFDPNKPL